MTVENPDQIIAMLQAYLAEYGLKLIAALAIFFVGRIVVRWLQRLTERVLTKGKADPMIVGFVSSLVYIGLMAFVVLAALGQLGIQTTSLIAVLGAAGLAIGLALQGSLSNFAAGFLMIVFRPFKVGDFIEGAGVAGTVESIQMFTTTIRSGDNKTIIVPNGSLANGNIVNFSAKPTRRVDMVFGAAYGADIQQVRDLLKQIINDESRVLKEPEPLVAVGELADSSVNFVVRVWVKTSDYWPVFYAITEQVKLRFDQADIEIPFPQRQLHVREQKMLSV